MENNPVSPSPDEQEAPIAQSVEQEKPTVEKDAPAAKQEKAVEKKVSDDKKPKKKKKSRALRTILKVIIWIVVIAIVVFLTLFLTSKIAEFDSITEMLEYIRDQLSSP
jgi:cell division septal protein FtsQ